MNKRIVILESVAGPLYWVILAASIWVLLLSMSSHVMKLKGCSPGAACSRLW